MEQMKMHSPDLTQQNIEKIRALFPNCVTEAQGSDGKIKLAIDFDQLKQELSGSIVEGPQERYHLNWPGKREALLTANAPIAKTLRPCREESVDFDTTQNLFIEGDNLDALKLLQETYLGKVKMIYIDPPYNTGNDFLYNDYFADNTEAFLKKSIQTNEEGQRLTSNTEANGRFHSDWLSNFYKRIKLAKNLLEPEGILAISIDDNEIANLLHVIDEEFGWQNRKVICVKMSESSGLKMGSVKKSGTIPKLKEYLVLCSPTGIKGINLDGIPKESWDKEYNIYLRGLSFDDREVISKAINGNPENTSVEDLDLIAKKIKLIPVSEAIKEYDLEEEDKKIWLFENSWRICQCATSSSVFKLAKEKFNKHNHEVFFVKSATGIIYPVRSVTNQKSKKPRVQLIFADDNSTINPGDLWIDIKTTGLDGEGGVSFKNGKKPLKLLSRILKMKTITNSVVMDFYAGSGSFAHSILEHNSKTGDNAKYICIQIPEVFNERNDDHKAAISFCLENNIAANVSELSKERIRRAGEKIPVGDCHENWNKDIGFRVLKVDTSNMSDIYYSPDQISQGNLELLVNNIKEDRTDEDLLFQVLLDWGVDLTLPIRKETICNKTVFFVDDNALVACFDANITEELIKALAESAPLRVVFRDDGFASDTVKINAEQIFKQLAPGTQVKSI